MFRLKEWFGGRPGAREERMRGWALDVAVLVDAEAREEVQAVLGAGGGDIEEARGLDVFGFGIEAVEVLVGRIRIRAGGLDGSQKQITCAADELVEEEQVGIAAAGARVEAWYHDGAELEALGFMDRHDLEVVVGRVDVRDREEVV